MSVSLLCECINSNDVDALKQLVTLDNVNSVLDFTFGRLSLLNAVIAIWYFPTRMNTIKWLVEEMHAGLSGALYNAAIRVDDVLVKYLIEAKANVNEEDERGNIPLICRNCSPEIIMAFINAGVNVKHKCDPLGFCLCLLSGILTKYHTGYIECAKVMMQAGARLQYYRCGKMPNWGAPMQDPKIELIPPDWAVCYEKELDVKWRNCVRAARELYLVMCRCRVPRDVRLFVVRAHVKRTWLHDTWLYVTGSKAAFEKYHTRILAENSTRLGYKHIKKG